MQLFYSHYTKITVVHSIFCLFVASRSLKASCSPLIVTHCLCIAIYNIISARYYIRVHAHQSRSQQWHYFLSKNEIIIFYQVAKLVCGSQVLRRWPKSSYRALRLSMGPLHREAINIFILVILVSKVL